jgi:hypothetical protein
MFMYEVGKGNVIQVSMSITNITIGDVKTAVVVKLIYNGSVKLTDFKLYILNKSLLFGDVSRGEYVRNITIDVYASKELLDTPMALEFKVAGLYHLSAIVRW